MVPERSAHWLRGREAKQTETGINVPDEVGEVADKIIKMAALEQEGKFKTDHENDVLTHSLGNPEHPGRVEFILIIFQMLTHPGRVRGISSKLTWKDGFGPEWAPTYKSRRRYKEQMKG